MMKNIVKANFDGLESRLPKSESVYSIKRTSAMETPPTKQEDLNFPYGLPTRKGSEIYSCYLQSTHFPFIPDV